MGILDFFGREPRAKADRTENVNTNTMGDFNTVGKQNTPVSVFNPTTFKDVETIIDCLKRGKTAIVHLTNLKNETAIRVLDMLSGAVYALNGGVYEMEKNIFMFSPTGVEVL